MGKQLREGKIIPDLDQEFILSDFADYAKKDTNVGQESSEDSKVAQARRVASRLLSKLVSGKDIDFESIWPASGNDSDLKSAFDIRRYSQYLTEKKSGVHAFIFGAEPDLVSLKDRLETATGKELEYWQAIANGLQKQAGKAALGAVTQLRSFKVGMTPDSQDGSKLIEISGQMYAARLDHQPRADEEMPSFSTSLRVEIDELADTQKIDFERLENILRESPEHQLK